MSDTKMESEIVRWTGEATRVMQCHWTVVVKTKMNLKVKLLVYQSIYVNLGVLSQKHLKAKMIVKFILLTFLS